LLILEIDTTLAEREQGPSAIGSCFSTELDRDPARERAVFVGDIWTGLLLEVHPPAPNDPAAMAIPNLGVSMGQTAALPTLRGMISGHDRACFC
jgi:hypothetical protein